MPSLELRLLGGFQAIVGDQTLTGFPTDKVRALLAYLAVESGRPHRRDAVAGLLWPEQPEADARRNLRKGLFQLRETLAAAGLPDPDLDALLVTTRQSIELNADLLDLDLSKWRAALALVDAHPHETLNSCGVCLPQLETAVALLRGPFLEGFYVRDAPGFENWQLQQQDATGQEIQQVLDRLGEAFEKRGAFQDVEKYATIQLALDPYREDATRRLMRALAAQGKRAEALSHFEASRRTLEEELGIAPEPETSALHGEIEAGTWSYAAPAAPALHNFPAQTTRFVGRRAEIDLAITRLSAIDCRLLTLVGPGGVGKSRLALEVGLAASERMLDFPDGVFWIPLASTPGAHLLETAIGMVTGANFSGSTSTRLQLLAHLKPLRALLVLDNFEHLTEGAGLVTEILEACAGIKALTTSREPLSLQGEWRIVVDGLAFPVNADSGQDRFDAVVLFEHLLERLHPDHRPCEDPASVGDICRLVNGMPLALEMVAALTRVYTCEELVAEISSGLDLLTAPFRDTPERHRSIRAVFEHSWNQLNRSEQRALVRLSVFRGGISEKAAAVVAGTDRAALARLLDKSMLQRLEIDRFAIHPLLNQFLSEKLPAMVERDPAETDPRTLHSRHFLGLLSEAARELGRQGTEDAQAKIGKELDNIRVGWDWALAAGMIAELHESAPGFMRYYMLTGLIREREEMTGRSARILAGGTDSQDPHRLHLLNTLYYFNANSLGLLGKIEAALEPGFEALRLANRLEDPTLIANAQGLIGHLYQDQGDYLQALRYQEDALASLGPEVDPGRKALLLVRLATAYFRTARYEESGSMYREAYEIYEGLNYQPGMADALSGMGIVKFYERQYHAALAYYEQAQRIDEKLGNRVALYRHAVNMGNSLRGLGERDRALEQYRRAAAINEDAGLEGYAGQALTGIARTLNELGRPEDALEWLERSIRKSREAGYRADLAEGLIELARVMLELDRPEAARDAYREAVDLAGTLNPPIEFFRLRLLEAGLGAVFDGPEPARSTLEKMLAEYPHEDRQVAIQRELDRIARRSV